MVRKWTLALLFAAAMSFLSFAASLAEPPRSQISALPGVAETAL
jgi:hypothetical protein